MSKKSNRLKARLRMEQSRRRAYLKQYDDAILRREFWREQCNLREERLKKLEPIVTRLATVTRHRELDLFEIRFAISDVEVEHLARDTGGMNAVLSTIVEHAFRELTESAMARARDQTTFKAPPPLPGLRPPRAAPSI